MKKGKEKKRNTNFPLIFERFQIYKRLGHALICEDGFVLLQQPIADLRVFRLGHGVLQVCFFELVKRHNDAEDFGEGVVEVTLGAAVGELDFLNYESLGSAGGVWNGAKLREEVLGWRAYLVETDCGGEGCVGNVAVRRRRVGLPVGIHGGEMNDGASSID